MFSQVLVCPQGGGSLKGRGFCEREYCEGEEVL